MGWWLRMFAWSCFLSLVPGSRHAQAQDTTLDPILASWNKRQTSISSISYQLRGKLLLTKGSFTYQDKEPPDPHPATDTFLDRKGSWLLDFKNNRIRREVHEDRFESPPYYSLTTFDGSKLMHAEPRSKNPRADGAWPDKTPDVSILDTHSGLLLYFDYPLFIAHGSIPTGEQWPNMRNVKLANRRNAFVLHSRAVRDGVPCVVLRSTRGGETVECWVDPARDNVVLRWASIGQKDQLLMSIDLEYQETDFGWLPRAWTSSWYRYMSPRLEERALLDNSEMMTVVSFEVEPAIEMTRFQIAPEPGQNLQDLPNEKLFRIQADGSRIEIGPGASEIDRRFWTLIGSTVLVLVVMFVLLWSRYRKSVPAS